MGEDDRYLDVTSPKKLKKIASKLMNASFNTTLNVDIIMRSDFNCLDKPVLEVVFFKDDKKFSVKFFTIFPIFRNTVFYNDCISLMENSSLFENFMYEHSSNVYDVNENHIKGDL